MLVVADNLDEIRKKHASLVGFWGHPPARVVAQVAERYKLPFVDLDVWYGAPTTRTIPDAYCQIIRNCLDNALALRDRLTCVVAASGKEKCDAGRYAAALLKKLLEIEVITTANEELTQPRAPLLSQATGSPKKRVVRIMQGIIDPLDQSEAQAAAAAAGPPTHGFWGTPPHPIELLDLFWPTTHLFGWTRCVEQGRPADLELELTVPQDLPIVFFSQGFCPKAQLARHLAQAHRGLHVDTHEAIGAATTAKIEAFIRLTAPGGDPLRHGAMK